MPYHIHFHSFIHSFINSFIHSFIHSSTHSFIHLFTLLDVQEASGGEVGHAEAGDAASQDTGHHAGMQIYVMIIWR